MSGVNYGYYPQQQAYYPQQQQAYYPQQQQAYYPQQQAYYPQQQAYYPQQQAYYPQQQAYYPQQQGNFNPSASAQSLVYQPTSGAAAFANVGLNANSLLGYSGIGDPNTWAVGQVGSIASLASSAAMAGGSLGSLSSTFGNMAGDLASMMGPLMGGGLSNLVSSSAQWSQQNGALAGLNTAGQPQGYGGYPQPQQGYGGYPYYG